MATIRTAIALYDGVTAPLQAMHKAMNIVLNSFEAMQRASGNSVDTSAIREARDELARAGAAFDEIEENIRQAGNQQDRFNRRIRDGTTAADGLWGKLKGIAATVGGLAAAKKLLNISDQFSNTNARLNNAMINFDDGGSLTDLEKKVMASAQRSRTSYMDAASSIAKLGLNARDAFGSMDEVIAFQELVNKQFVIGGASVQEQQAAMIQLKRTTLYGNSGTPTSPVSNSLIAALPADLRAVMQPVTKYTDNTGNASNTSGAVTATTDYLFDLAEFEVFGTRNWANQYEQNSQLQYDYYKAGNSKVAYKHSAVSTAVWWGLRSPIYGNFGIFMIVWTDGSYTNNSANTSGGLRPGFAA